MDKTHETICKLIDEEDVRFIRLQFTDMFGTLKNIAVTSSQLTKSIEKGCSFDGTLIRGFTDSEKADLILMPDLDTFSLFPWRPQQGKVARFLCDVKNSDGTAFPADPRYILRKSLKEASEMGLSLNVGPEWEFFLFPLDDNGKPDIMPEEKAGYCDVAPIDHGENVRRDIILTLEEMGYVVESSHHELAPCQHEIDLGFGEALYMADAMVTFKLAVRTIAKRHGVFASFMPKPRSSWHGSGLHINLSLHEGDRNIFNDPDRADGMSQEASWFIGGIMEHIRGMALITNPLVNSYKRIVPGFVAPTDIMWSTENRATLIRVPGGAAEKRVELRSPDPSTNPYLALAVMLSAGLDGIRRRTEPENTGEKLPQSLHESIRAFQEDSFIQDVLGEQISRRFVEEKEKEWHDYRSQVTKWELDQYLSLA